MSEYISIIDNIKQEYFQIDIEKFEIIINFLSYLWDETKNVLNIKATDYTEKLSELIDIFNPKRSPATRLRLVEKLPTMNKVFESKKIVEEELNKLRDFKVLYIIERGSDEYLLLTPEGLVFMIALQNSKKIDEYYRLNTVKLQDYEKVLQMQYRNFIFEKFENLQMSTIPLISIKEIAILLFFMVNGSIGNDKAFVRTPTQLEKALNSIVQAFNKNMEMNEESRNDNKIVPIRILQRDLSTLQKKIGYSIYNVKSTYFLKSKDISYLKKVLKQSIEKKREDNISSRWDFFIKEYEYWRPYFREKKVCFYNYKDVENLENEIMKRSFILK